MISAAEAGEALGVVAVRLLEKDVVQPEGFAVLQRLGLQLDGQRDAVTWSLEIDRGDPLLFRKTEDKNGNQITLSLVSKKITVSQTESDLPPFDALDVAIEIDDEDQAPVARWHLDMANRGDGQIQPGPLFHLQYGGHQEGFRHLDHPLKVPRWCHPPMEVALLCELVTANFFPAEWAEIREDPNWCEAISLFERLCFTNYIAKLNSTVSIRSITSLGAMWATDWT